jgi:hypothetical protein
MAHFAEINDDNIVTRVLVVPEEEEDRGQEFLADDLDLGGTWIQTSYNTREGVHHRGGTPLRGNYAGVGFTYDSDADEFIPPSPYPSWSWNGNEWLPPTPYPDDGSDYEWDEDTTSWVEATA